MRRVSAVLCVSVFLGLFWNLNQAEAFPKRLSLPFSKESKASSPPPVVLNVEEDVTQRTPNKKRWVVHYENGKQGDYTELRPGLHYNVGTPEHPQYENADPTITPSHEGAETKTLLHPVKFKSHLAYDTPVIQQSLDHCPSCKDLSFTNSPAMIVYHDRSTGQSVVLARSQPAQLTYQNNIATYADAFDHIRADVRYTVGLDRLEQDVLLYEKPLPPSAYGLNDSTTVLTVLTRLFDLDTRVANNSHILELSSKQVLAESPSVLKALMTEPTTAAIGFEQTGKVTHLLDRSYVYSKPGKKGDRQAVQKRLVTLQGIHFLSEEIPAQFIQDQDLPKVKDEERQPLAKVQPLETLQVATNSNFNKDSDERLALNRAPPSVDPVVIDYTSISGTGVDGTFEFFKTYFITGPTTFTGTVTFQGATIKFDSVATDAHINLINPPVFETQQTSLATFTSKHDDEEGEIITGSTGNPAAGDYVGALILPGGSTVHDAWFRYGDIGIAFVDTGTLTVQDSALEWSNGALAIQADTGDQTITLNNNLFAFNVDAILMDDLGNYAQTLTATNLTIGGNSGNAFSTSLTHAGSSYEVINSLFDTFSGTQVFSGTAPAVEDHNAFHATPELGTGPNDLDLNPSGTPVLPGFFLDQTSPVIDAGNQAADAAGMYLQTTNKDHTPEANSTLDIGFHHRTQVWYFSLFAWNSIWIKDRAKVYSGFVGVDDVTTPNTSWLNPDAQVVIGPNVVTAEVTTDKPPHVLADSVKIEINSVLNSNVYHTVGNLNNSGTISGNTFDDLPLPLLSGFPPIFQPPFTGTQDIVVATGTQQTLLAGSYRDITVESNATLILSDNTDYDARSITLETGSTLLFSEGTDVHVQNTFTSQSNVRIEAEPGELVPVHKMVFVVEGVDGVTKAIDLGDSNLVTTVMLARNGTLRMGANTQAHGIFMANDILVEADAEVNLVDINQPPMVATPTITPNGGTFTDSVVVELATATAGAELRYTTDGSVPTATSTLYDPVAKIALSPSAFPQTIRAIAISMGLTNSAIATSNDFTVLASGLDPVVIDPPSGTFQDFVFLTMTTAAAGAQIFYTTDGSDPTEDSTLYEFSFSLNQSATVRAIAVKAGFVNSLIIGETYVINPVVANTLSGRILDANALANTGIETPIAGVTVSLLNTGVSTTSGADGVFTLNNVPLGNHPLDLDATSLVDVNGNPIYASFREEFNIQPGLNVVGRPLFLPQIDNSSLTTIDPLVETTVTNPNLGISLVVPAGSAKNADGTNFTGQMSISEVPRGLAPATLPEELDPGLLITLQPVGVTFSTPARLSFPNIDQLPTGPEEEANVWSLDPTTAEFKIVGTNSISADGTTLEWKSGGIASTGWHALLAALLEALGFGSNGENHDPGDAEQCPIGSTNVVQTGELIEEHDLVSYRSFGINRSLRFVYDSLTADPRPIIGAQTTVRKEAGVPPTISSSLQVDSQLNGTFSNVLLGNSQAFEVFTSPVGFNENMDEPLLQSAQFDATSLPTGRYPYRMKVTSNYPQSRVSNFRFGNVLVNNEQNSPFGAGWTLDGLQKVHPQDDISALLTEGDGGIKFFFTKEGLEEGVFSPPVTTAGLNLSTTFAFLPGDVNGDGFADIFEAIRNTNTVTVRFGDGNGNFSTPLNIFMGAGIIPEFVNLVEDLNNDNVNDLVTFNKANDSIGILLSDGIGGFLPPSFVPVANGPVSGAFEDFDGDGDKDIVVSNSLSSSISVLLGDGNGGYTLSNVFATEPNTGGVIPSDFNGDGNLDILTTHTPSTDFSLLFGDGAGNFSPHIVINLDNTLFSWRWADFNADGKTDLVTGKGANIEIHLSDGTGAFLLANTIQFPFSGSYTFNPRDYNDDGIIDLAVANSLSTDFFIYLGTGNGQFGAPNTFGNGTVGQQFRVADVNGDSVDDFIYKPVGDLTNLTIALGVSGPTAPPGEFSKLVKNDTDGTFTRTMKGGTLHHFDVNGFHTSTVDRNGNTTTYAYDAGGNLISITDAANLVTTLAYDANGKLDTITDPANRVTDFDIDINGDLTKITDPDGTFRIFGYDAQHHLTLQKNKRGFDTTYTYDFAGRNTGSALPDGSTRQVSPVQAVGLVDPASGIGTATNPASVTRPEEAFASFTDGNGNVTKFEVDAFGKSTKQADPLNNTTNTVRDSDGNPIQIIHPSGSTVTNTFDGSGNLLTSTENETGALTTLAYEPVFNRIISIVDPLRGNPNILDYDESGNLKEITNLEGTKYQIFYEDMVCPGLNTKVISGVGLADESFSTRTYNPSNCNLSVDTDSLGKNINFEYDLAGNITQVTNENGKIKRLQYDSMNRLKKVIDESNIDPNPACGVSGVTCNDYDEEGNLTQVIGARGNSVLLSYDPLNRLITRTDPLGLSETISYDGDGNINFTVDRKGQTIEYKYDIANRLIQKILLPGTTNEKITDFQYNELAVLTSAVDQDSALTFSYDAKGRILTASTNGSTVQPNITLSYTYDQMNNRKALTDSVNSTVINYSYDALNRLDTIVTPEGKIFNFDFDSLGRRKRLTSPNGVTTDYVYDAMGQLKNLTHELNSVIISSFSYTYDFIGNRDSLITNRSNVAVAQSSLVYLYDDINRLTQATRPLVGDPNETFQYDEVGNRLLKDGQLGNSIFDLANRLLEDDGFLFGYDNNGNQTSKTNKTTGEVTEFNYDLEDQLVQILKRPDAVSPPTSTIKYTYDSFGRRIQKDIDGIITKYIYDGQNIYLEFDGNNALQARYTHGLRVDEPLVVRRGGVDFFYHADGLGSITELTDSTGTNVQSYVYDSFGNLKVFDQVGGMITPSGGIINPFTYTGREFDTETETYYYRARYYNSSIGRFLSGDLNGFTNSNFIEYIYVKDNPLNFTDPTGLFISSRGNTSVTAIGYLDTCEKCITPISRQERKNYANVYNPKTHDKFLHCIVGAVGSIKCGATCARLAGLGKEWRDFKGKKGTPEIADIDATWDGVNCASKHQCRKNITKCCNKKGHFQ